MKLHKSLQATALGLGAGGGLLALALAATPVLAPAAIGQVSADHPGAGVYQKACAVCHDNPGTTRAATLASTVTARRTSASKTGEKRWNSASVSEGSVRCSAIHQPTSRPVMWCASRKGTPRRVR